ncbi:flavin reductase family protein [Clostridiaceae bacterium 35-E11]
MKENDIKVGLRKITNPIGLVTAQKDKKRDVTTIAWMSKVSNHPPLIMMSISPERYIHHLIQDTGEFGLSILSEKQEDLALYCGTKSAYEVDKFRDAPIETDQGATIKAPLIKESVVNFECKVVNTMTAGDHTLFIGEVLAAYYEEDKKPLVMTDKMGTLEF